MSQLVEPGFAEISLGGYLANNPQSRIQIENNTTVLVEKPWGRDDARLKFSVNDHDVIADLNQLAFDTRFDAIFHKDTNKIEFVFGFVRQDDHSATFRDRAFKFHFGGREYACCFAEPTDRLMRLARHFEGGLPSDLAESSVPQLRAFKDFQRLDTIPERAKQFFEGRVSRSFFLSCDGGFADVNLELLARHLNFMIRYYDRESPCITIKDPIIAEGSMGTRPLRMTATQFPSALAISKPVDDLVLRLLEVASHSASRIAFLYYYQIFEYAGYYYIDEKARLALRNALRDPALICSGEEKVSELFSIFTDLTHNDEVKMRKVIEEYCDPKVIWREVKNDIEFFASAHSFDGGFVSQPLVSIDTSESSWCSMWMPKTFDSLTKIRNVLVHAREKRESRVILPSQRNNALLARYVPLIERIASQLALKT
jgi:hypothetical protein